MALAFPLNLKWLRELVGRCVIAYDNVPTRRVGYFYGITRWKNAIMDRAYYGKPLYVPFEGTRLPVPEQYDSYLRQLFGDYMKMPAEEQRRGKHIIRIDFGKY